MCNEVGSIGVYMCVVWGPPSIVGHPRNECMYVVEVENEQNGSKRKCSNTWWCRWCYAVQCGNPVKKCRGGEVVGYVVGVSRFR